MKTKLAGLLALCMVLTLTCSVSAAELTDMYDGKIEISGTAQPNQKLNVLVLAPGATAQAAMADVSLVSYQNSVAADENGNYSVEIPLSIEETAPSGYYTVLTGGKAGETPKEETVLYSPFAKVKKLLGTTKTMDAAALSTFLTENTESLYMEDAIFQPAYMAKIAEKLAAELQKNPLSFADDEAAKASWDRFHDFVSAYAAVKSYNAGNTAAIFDENGDFLFKEVLGLDQLDKDGLTIYSLYQNKMTAAGQNAVRQGMLGKSFATPEDLLKNFARQTILNVLANSNESGSGYVGACLTAANCEYAGISVPKYSALTNKIYANAAIAKAKNTITNDNLESVIEECADAKEPTFTPGNQGGGSGAGSAAGRGKQSTFATGQVVDPTTQENILPYSDISDYGWAQDAIVSLSSKGIMNGVGGGNFDPSGYVKREQLAKMAALAFHLGEAENTDGFTDVEAGSWYAPYVYAARERGAVKGFSETVFGTGQNVSREDFCTVLYRLLGAAEGNAAAVFTDSGDISEYAVEAVTYLHGKGVISGYEDGSFRPQAPVTRAEAAKILSGILK